MEMEIPVINRIGDFEAGITSLQNPSFVPRILSLSSSSFLKWGALILAFLASFSAIIRRIKFLIFRLHRHFFPAPNNTIQFDYNYDTDTDSSCSSSVSSEDENEQEEEEDEEPTVSPRIDEDFSVKGGSGYHSDHRWSNGNLRKRRNRSIGDLFSEFTNGKNVVKLWDNLGLRFNESINNLSVFDTNYEQNLFSIFGEKSQISVSPSSLPAVIVSAETTNVSGHLLKVWDTRVGGRLPGILAEWRPKLGKIVGIGGDGGLGKVYVRDEVTGKLTVGDMRKMRSPLALTESNADTWWDADESVDELSGGDSVFRRG